MTNVLVLANIATLRSYTGGGSATPTVWLEGYANPGDGGEGIFNYIPADTTSGDNGGTIIINNSGSGSYRYYRADKSSALNICWFGAVANVSSSDSAPALNAALASLPGSGGEIFIPAGAFYFDSTISFSIPSSAAFALFSVSIVGCGSDASVLSWPNSTSGIGITASTPGQSIHIRDVSIVTSQTNGFAGLALVRSSTSSGVQSAISDVTRVAFRGTSPQLEYWTYAIYVQGFSNVNYVGVMFVGSLPSAAGGTGAGIAVGIFPTSGGSFDYSLVHNFTDCNFYSGSVGIEFNKDVQGVTVSQCNFGTNLGISIPSGGSGLAQLTIIGSQFGCSNYPISISSPAGGVSIIGNAFYYPNPTPSSYAAVFINNTATSTQSICIQGNTFNGTSVAGSLGSGVVVHGTISPPSNLYGVVSGNTFTNMALGIDLTGAEYWNVYGNVYSVTIPQQVLAGTGTNSIGVATK